MIAVVVALSLVVGYRYCPPQLMGWPWYSDLIAEWPLHRKRRPHCDPATNPGESPIAPVKK